MRNKILVLAKRLSQLPKHLSKTEKNIILSLCGVILITLGLFCFNRFFVKKTLVPDYGGTFIEGEVGNLHTLIPILKQNEVEKDISKLIFSSLIKYNQNREIVGDLAEKWDVSPDGKNYTFYLRDAKWHDGGKLTSDDVLFTFSLILDKETKSPFFETFQGVEVKKVNEKTVVFNLKAPFVPFLSSLTIPILPKHAFYKVTPSTLPDSQFAKKPIGSGPFRFVKIDRQREELTVILEANKEYYLKRPFLNKFIFKIYDSEITLQKAFEKKQLQGTFEQVNNKLGKNYKVTLPQYKAIFFNLNSPSLDTELRKALSFATNKEEMISQIEGAKRLDSPILPGFLGYKEGERWDFDLERAKNALAKSKISSKQLRFLVSQSEENQQLVEIIKKQWAEIGIELEIIAETNSFLEKSVKERNYDVLLAGVNQKADPDPYPFWHSSQASESGLNFSAFKNKEADKVLEEARQTIDQNARRQKYEKFIDILQSEVPAIFLYQPTHYYHVYDKIKGVTDVQGVVRVDRFWNVENWYINTKAQPLK